MKKKVLILLLMIPLVSAVTISPTKIKVYDSLNSTLINNTLSEFELPYYVHTIIFFKKPNHDYCGYYLLGGKIYINLHESCYGYDFSNVLNHELRHAYWFNQMTWEERNNFCYKYDLIGAHSRDCWEAFANHFGDGVDFI